MLDGTMQPLYRRRTTLLTDRRTILNIVSWTLLAVVVCTLVARFAMKLSMKTSRRRIGVDDLFVALAALFSFGQTIAVSIESTHALGQHVVDLTPGQRTIYQKAEYAACMLYIANMGCARISVCLVIRKVLPGIVAKYTALTFAGFTAIWTVTGVLVNAFPCHLPNPWEFTEAHNCYDLVAFVNYIGVTNIVVEVLLVMVPLFIWNVRLSTGRRVSVSLVFLARLSIVAAVSAQLSLFNSATLNDYSYASWAAVLCEQIAQNLSVISACLPCLHPFIISILAGTTEPETIKLNYGAPTCVRQYLDRKTPSFDPTSSQSSRATMTPLAEKQEESYCHPLATYGLDRSSTHVHSQSVTRFPANVAKPVFTPTPPQNFFNRLIEMPRSRPETPSSVTNPKGPPKNLGEVGVLPIIDWDSESSISGDSRKRSPSRKPTAEYVFDRSKVISVPEERHLYDDGVKQFAPPLPSPKFPRRPPRAF